MLEKRLRELKPNVSDKTIKVYASHIRRLRRIDKNLDYAAISSYLKTLQPQLAANVLTPVIVLEGRERYGELFKTFAAEAEKMRGSQRFTSRELDNWATVRQIKEGIKRAKFDVDRLELLVDHAKRLI